MGLNKKSKYFPSWAEVNRPDLTITGKPRYIDNPNKRADYGNQEPGTGGKIALGDWKFKSKGIGEKGETIITEYREGSDEGVKPSKEAKDRYSALLKSNPEKAKAIEDKYLESKYEERERRSIAKITPRPAEILTTSSSDIGRTPKKVPVPDITTLNGDGGNGDDSNGGGKRKRKSKGVGLKYKLKKVFKIGGSGYKQRHKKDKPPTKGSCKKGSFDCPQFDEG
jgi:hypothetical protein